jgi:hypothetical protein
MPATCCCTDISTIREVEAPKKSAPSRKAEARCRWVEIEARPGKVYYHNTETGEDSWEKPIDFSAKVEPKPNIISFEDNDPLKIAVMREERRLQRERLGISSDIIQDITEKTPAEKIQAILESHDGKKGDGEWTVDQLRSTVKSLSVTMAPDSLVGVLQKMGFEHKDIETALGEIGIASVLAEGGESASSEDVERIDTSKYGNITALTPKEDDKTEDLGVGGYCILA